MLKSYENWITLILNNQQNWFGTLFHAPRFSIATKCAEFSTKSLIVLTKLLFDILGTTFMRQTYKKLGQLEPVDQTDFANYLKDTYSYIDGDNIAIWGWVSWKIWWSQLAKWIGLPLEQ